MKDKNLYKFISKTILIDFFKDKNQLTEECRDFIKNLTYEESLILAFGNKKDFLLLENTKEDAIKIEKIHEIERNLSNYLSKPLALLAGGGLYFSAKKTFQPIYKKYLDTKISQVKDVIDKTLYHTNTISKDIQNIQNSRVKKFMMKMLTDKQTVDNLKNIKQTIDNIHDYSSKSINQINKAVNKTSIAASVLTGIAAGVLGYSVLRLTAYIFNKVLLYYILKYKTSCSKFKNNDYKYNLCISNIYDLITKKLYRELTQCNKTNYPYICHKRLATRIQEFEKQRMKYKIKALQNK